MAFVCQNERYPLYENAYESLTHPRFGIGGPLWANLLSPSPFFLFLPFFPFRAFGGGLNELFRRKFVCSFFACRERDACFSLFFLEMMKGDFYPRRFYPPTSSLRAGIGSGSRGPLIVFIGLFGDDDDDGDDGDGE